VMLLFNACHIYVAQAETRRNEIWKAMRVVSTIRRGIRKA